MNPSHTLPNRVERLAKAGPRRRLHRASPEQARQFVAGMGEPGRHRQEGGSFTLSRLRCRTTGLRGHVVNAIEFPLTFATAGLVGLGGLALLMGAVLSSVAELLALLRARRGWAGGDGRGPGIPVARSGLPRPRAGALVATVLAWHEGSETNPDRSDGEVREASGPGPRVPGTACFGVNWKRSRLKRLVPSGAIFRFVRHLARNLTG